MPPARLARADIMNNLETFRVASSLSGGFYPQGFDSLLTSAAALASRRGLATGPNGTPPAMPFTVGSISADPYAEASFGIAFGANPNTTTGAVTYNVYDQDSGYATNGEDVSSSFNTVRELYGTGGVATVPLTGNGVAVWQAAFPGGTSATSTGSNPVTTYTPPASATGVTLIAFGVGPNCKAVGQTMATAPMQTGQQPGFYARYFAIFALYGTGNPSQGKPADLKLVLDSDYNTIGANITSFKQSGPSDQ